MPRTWRAVLARMGTPTGDGRILDPAGASSRDLPLPLSWQQMSGDGHGGSQIVARIESLSFDNGMVTATGTMLDSAPYEVYEQIEAGVIGPSVDLDDIEYVMSDDELLVLTKWRVAGATLVSIPAFAEVSITLDPEPVEPMGESELTPYGNMAEWSAETATGHSTAVGPKRVDSAVPASISANATASRSQTSTAQPAELSSLRAEVSETKHGATHATPNGWPNGTGHERASDGRTQTTTSPGVRQRPNSDGLGHPEDARSLTRPDGGNSSGSGGFDGATWRSTTQSSKADVVSAELPSTPQPERAHTSQPISTMTMSRESSEAGSAHPATGGSELSEMTPNYSELRLAGFSPESVGLTASGAISKLPPLEWFRDPQLQAVTPLTVTPEGRVFGTIAPWGSCHVGLPGCVTPPPSYSNYSYFLQSSQQLADGSTIPVGTLVAGPRHADAQLAFHAATQHYDDPSAAVARVMAGEDEYGIWVAGWVLPYATPQARETFMSSPVSGDWRRVGGNLELIAVCSVNSAGFPVPRARVAFSNGHQRTLVGTFGVQPVKGDHFRDTAEVMDADTARARWAWAQTKGR